MAYGYPKPRRYSDPPTNWPHPRKYGTYTVEFESQKITQNRPKHLNGLKFDALGGSRYIHPGKLTGTLKLI